jgi:hypothetical protein
VSKLEVFFFTGGGDGCPLLCKKIVRSGDKIRGHVINGEWIMKYSPGLLLACDGFGSIVNRIKTDLVRTVAIPDGMKGDYNTLIEWARTQTGV